MLYSYHTIVETLDEKEFLSNYLVKTFMQAQDKLKRKYDSRHIYNEVVSRIKLKSDKDTLIISLCKFVN